MTTMLQNCITTGESPFESYFIKTDKLKKLLDETGSSLILYGAGATCNEVLKELFENQILPVCITDSDSAKANISIMNIPTLAPEDALRKAGSNAICLVAIWSISTFYKPFVEQLYSIGYDRIYFLDSDLRPRILPPHWVRDVQHFQSNLIKAFNVLCDDLSKVRMEQFIYSFLSSKVNHCNVIGNYKSLDGDVLNNDLLKLDANDVFVHCRTGFQDDRNTYLNALNTAKLAFLFEPTKSGRMKTKEYFNEQPGTSVFIFPYLLGNEEKDCSFQEKIFFTKFIDQEQIIDSHAHTIPLDVMSSDISPTILHFDMTQGLLEAMQGAEAIITRCKPMIILSGFQLASEAVQIIEAFPNYKYYMRYFGGITMRDGYALIIDTNAGQRE